MDRKQWASEAKRNGYILGAVLTAIGIVLIMTGSFVFGFFVGGFGVYTFRQSLRLRPNASNIDDHLKQTTAEAQAEGKQFADFFFNTIAPGRFAFRLGILILVLTSISAGFTIRDTFESTHVSGTVVDYETSRSADSEAGYRTELYAPKIRFVDSTDTLRYFTHNVRRNSKPWAIGERVSLVYVSESPETAKLFGFFSVFGLELLFALIGLVCLAISGALSLLQRGLHATLSDDPGDALKVIDSLEGGVNKVDPSKELP